MEKRDIMEQETGDKLHINTKLYILLMTLSIFFVYCTDYRFSKENFCKEQKYFIENCLKIYYPSNELIESDDSAVIDFTNLLKNFMNVSIDNIVHHETTRTGYGHSPYRRLYIVANDDTYDVIASNDMIYKKIPWHPHAIIEGPYEGYVAYPDIDVQQEKLNLYNLFKYYKYFAQKYNQIHPENLIDIKLTEKDINKFL